MRARRVILTVMLMVCPGWEAAAWEERVWTVDGRARHALVQEPEVKSEDGAPVIFAFHGHGGNMRNAARSFPMQRHWPEALVVCMQGLPTPGKLTDPEGKRNGWQHGAEDMGGRDLKFFDAVFATLKAEYRIDESRVYAMGHSNGGGFTYLLWAERGGLFAAMAPSGSAGRESLPKLKPKPVLHVAGEKDPLVKYEWQKRMIAALIALNQCGEGVAWDQDRNCTLHPSGIGAPVVTAIHPGGHEYPKQAPEVIAKFFKQHRKPAVKEPGAGPGS
jgi:polyhydroxybutyrate depolymerase